MIRTTEEEFCTPPPTIGMRSELLHINVLDGKSQSASLLLARHSHHHHRTRLDARGGGAKYNGSLWQKRNMDVRFEWNAVPVFETKCSTTQKWRKQKTTTKKKKKLLINIYNNSYYHN